MNNIAIFASGTGSNFMAIHNAIMNKELNANIVCVVSDRPNSIAIKNAKRLGLNTLTFNPKHYQNKKEFEQLIRDELQKHNVSLIVLAGYMRLIGETLLDAFEQRIINIHPSLLPLYKGKDAIGQALSNHAIETGVTVHYVDSGMDTGSIIDQESLPIYPNESRESLEKRVHEIEHRIYKKVIKNVLKELSK